MKSSKLLTAFLICLLAIALIGCGQKESSETKNTTDMEESADAVVLTFEETKAEFVTSAKIAIAAMETKITAAKDKIAAMPEMTQKPLNTSLETLNTLKTEAADKLAEVENADEAAFDAAKEAYHASMTKLDSAYTELSSKL